MTLFRTTSRRARRATSALAAITTTLTMTVVAIGATTAGPAAADHGDNTTDRAAFGFQTRGSIAGVPTNFGPFPAECAVVQTTPGRCDETLVRTPDPLDPLAAVGVFSAETVGTVAPLRADSNASVVNLSALPGTPLAITGEVIESQCTARVVDGRPVLEGGSTIVGLTIGGQPITVPAPDQPQTITIPIGPAATATVTFNEQIRSRNGSQLVVNAVHITADVAPGTPLAITEDIIIASSQCSVHPQRQVGPGDGAGAGAGSGFGYVEICKRADNSQGAVTGRFTFRFAGQSVRVPVGGCSAPQRVPAGRLVVREVPRDGIRMSACLTQPIQRLRHCDPNDRKAVVRIVEGGVRNETTLFVTNKRPVPGPNTGAVKVCNIAGEGVPVGARFGFTVGGRGVSVPAGPARQGGYCKLVSGFRVGTPVRVTEAARAGVRVSRITVRPAERKISTNRAQRTARVRIGRSFTVVTFTNTRS